MTQNLVSLNLDLRAIDGALTTLEQKYATPFAPFTIL